MNWELLQALAEYIKEGNENIMPVYEEAKELRRRMHQIFQSINSHVNAEEANI